MVKEEEKVKWYLRPLAVILSLFFVLGPFGLPLLYRSPKFSRKMKILLTVAVVVYTFYLIFAMLEIAGELYRRIEEFQEILAQTDSPSILPAKSSHGTTTICDFIFIPFRTGDCHRFQRGHLEGALISKREGNKDEKNFFR